jgi:hypothetical protein
MILSSLTLQVISKTKFHKKKIAMILIRRAKMNLNNPRLNLNLKSKSNN